MSVFVSKVELASTLRISLPCLDRWIDRWPEFPIEQRGGKGKAWQFDPEAVGAFLQGKRDEENEKKTARDEALAQFVLPLAITSEPVAPVPAGISLDDQIKAERLTAMRISTAEKAGELVQVGLLREVLTERLAELNSLLHGALRLAARELHLPDDVLRNIDRRLGDAQRTWFAQLEAKIGG